MRPSLKNLMRIVNLVEAGSGAWPDVLQGMPRSSFDDERRTAGEMLVKQQDSPRGFGSIMGGEVYGSLAVLGGCHRPRLTTREKRAPSYRAPAA